MDVTQLVILFSRRPAVVEHAVGLTVQPLPEGTEVVAGDRYLRNLLGLALDDVAQPLLPRSVRIQRRLHVERAEEVGDFAEGELLLRHRASELLGFFDAEPASEPFAQHDTSPGDLEGCEKLSDRRRISKTGLFADSQRLVNLPQAATRALQVPVSDGKP